MRARPPDRRPGASSCTWKRPGQRARRCGAQHALVDLDAVFTSGSRSMANGMTMPEYLGIQPLAAGDEGTQVGGCSFHPPRGARLAARINAGLCEVALITHGRKRGTHSVAMPVPRWGDSSTNSPVQAAVRRVRFRRSAATRSRPSRHMHEYGTTSEQLAEVAVATRKWARSTRGLDARADHHRRRARVAADRRAVSPARLLPGHRRRRRGDRTSAERAAIAKAGRTCSARESTPIRRSARCRFTARGRR